MVPGVPAGFGGASMVRATRSPGRKAVMVGFLSVLLLAGDGPVGQVVDCDLEPILAPGADAAHDSPSWSSVRAPGAQIQEHVLIPQWDYRGGVGAPGQDDGDLGVAFQVRQVKVGGAPAGGFVRHGQDRPGSGVGADAK